MASDDVMILDTGHEVDIAMCSFHAISTCVSFFMQASIQSISARVYFDAPGGGGKEEREKPMNLDDLETQPTVNQS